MYYIPRVLESRYTTYRRNVVLLEANSVFVTGGGFVIRIVSRDFCLHVIIKHVTLFFFLVYFCIFVYLR